MVKGEVNEGQNNNNNNENFLFANLKCNDICRAIPQTAELFDTKCHMFTVLISGAPLTNFNGGWVGVGKRFIFYTQRNHNFRICLPKQNNTYLWHTQKNTSVLFSQPKKSLCLFFHDPKKILASFIDPKKSLLAKISDPKNSLGPPIIKICEWCPGLLILLHCTI